MSTARRAFLTGLVGTQAMAAVALPQSKADAPNPDDPSLPAPDPVTLLLNRTGFGIREEEYQRAKTMGYDAWLESQLAYESIDDSAIETSIASALPTIKMTNGQILELVASTQKQFQAVDELRGATLLRQIYSPRQLFEVMVEFWTNHFNMLHIDGVVRYFKTVDDREVIRRHALGRFGDMLRASARSPAMLNSLDNVSNVVNGPNENYARELMELHTIGITGGYTEDDVKAVARCFTGWTTSAYQGGGNDVTYIFFAARHDYNAKTVLGMPIPAGQGEQDGNQVLDLLIAHPATARYLATKLAQRFVSDNPPQAIIDKVAASYIATGGDIRSMMRTLLTSDEFKVSADQKYKRPAEFVMSALRTVAPQFTGNYLRTIAEQLVVLGQLPYMWPTPDGYPDAKQHWINTSAQVARWNFGFTLAENSVTSITTDVNALIGSARTADELVDRLAARLLRRPLAANDRAALVGFAANRGMSHRPIPSAALIARAQELIGVLLGSAYFQYR